MKSEQVIQRLSTTPEASIENLQEHRYWLQCERAYTYQPIYRTDGRLMAIEVLTVVTHPSNPSQRIAPDRYFAEVAVRQRIDVLEEQLRMLATKQAFFEQHGILASVNVDGPTLMALRQNATLQALIATLPWMRFELVEHVQLPQDSSFASMCEFGQLLRPERGALWRHQGGPRSVYHAAPDAGGTEPVYDAPATDEPLLPGRHCGRRRDAGGVARRAKFPGSGGTGLFPLSSCPHGYPGKGDNYPLICPLPFV